MERRAIVIRTAGDPEIAGAIVDGMTKKVIKLNGQELGALRAELARLRARQDVRKYREDRDWHITQMELARKYGTRPHGAIYENFWLCYTLTWLTLDACWRRFVHLVWRGCQ